jgi:hypothetical protein
MNSDSLPSAFEAVENSGTDSSFFVGGHLWEASVRGGTPTMMGQQTRTESLFDAFRLEDQIPEDTPYALLITISI